MFHPTLKQSILVRNVSSFDDSVFIKLFQVVIAVNFDISQEEKDVKSYADHVAMDQSANFHRQ